MRNMSFKITVDQANAKSHASARSVDSVDSLVRCSLHWDCNGLIDDKEPCGHHAEHVGNGDCGCVCSRSIECAPNRY